MSHPSPPPRRLTRSTTDRYLGGVCGGLAQYLNVDATIVRLVVVVITVSTGGFPLALYVIALLLMPEDDRPRPPAGTQPPVYPPSAAPGPRPAPPNGPGDPVWGREGAPWEQPQTGPQSTRPDPEPPTDRT
jgi:phage shock protein C